ncbi:PilZ domain-containing protein [Bacteriovoracaceae bacterium]|nr:PilZ domain-containing protein [Bacteriovoracaceae bacterium]
MATKDANQKHYFTPVDDEEKFSMMERACEDKWKVFLWIQGKSDKDVEEFECISFDTENSRLNLKSSGGLLAKIGTSKKAGKEVFMKIGEGKSQYFTYSALTYSKEKKEYFVVLNKDMFKTQQRSNYRLMASRFIKLKFKIDDDHILDGLDVSAGGTSFVINDPEENEKYAKDAEFPDCELHFNGKKFAIPKAKIVAQFPEKDKAGNPTGKMCAGIAFMDLSSRTEEDLFIHINGEARAEEMRKKLAKPKD